MSIFYVKNAQIQGDTVHIEGEDVKHIKDVLRYEMGDELNVCDEEGKKYLTQIVQLSKEQITLRILEKSQETSEPHIEVTLFQGMPKADKLEWIIQKCTELGICEVVPVMTERVVVKLDEKNTPKKLERWNKIAEEAAKQSGRQKIPAVKNPINLQKMVENISNYDIVLLPYECEKEVTLKSVLRTWQGKREKVAILIGPEGGFSEEEIASFPFDNVKTVTLGPRILRTETAGIATLATVLYEWDS